MKLFAAASAAIAIALLATGAPAKTPQPRISMQAARAKALAYVPKGQIRSGELETERGRLIYSFDIQVPGRSGVEEVQISALDGSLISRKHESAAAESREAKSEPTEHKHR
ncbi:MAG: PepSY domain-containing protein [Alphaproteobacteria bacterium]|nr:PepSY domain-containing protein [Alphaproteobacteria bacterium]